MFVLDKPFISSFAEDTIKEKGYNVVFSNIANNPVREIREKFDGKIYTNSENSIEKIKEALFDTDIPRQIALFKDKIEFRKLIREIYPDFFFKEVSYDGLSNFKAEKFPYPFVIKPSIGFLSFGVHTVWDKNELDLAVLSIKNSLENSKGLFPKSVLNSEKFIIEEFIEGEEFAIDAYFDENSSPVILNIFYHPFLNKNDVADRMYLTSGEIIRENYPAFEALLAKIGQKAGLKNFPMHLELRKNGEKVTPIEANPLRCAGWCTTDLAWFAYGINVYECFAENKKPDWQKIFEKNKSTYAFIFGEIPAGVEKNNISSFDVGAFKKDIGAEILEERVFDFKKDPMFCLLFAKAPSTDAIKHVLSLDVKKYIKLR